MVSFLFIAQRSNSFQSGRSAIASKTTEAAEVCRIGEEARAHRNGDKAARRPLIFSSISDRRLGDFENKEVKPIGGAVRYATTLVTERLSSITSSQNVVYAHPGICPHVSLERDNNTKIAIDVMRLRDQETKCVMAFKTDKKSIVGLRPPMRWTNFLAGKL